jgi:ligand-binding sensor domain-containing protein
MKLKIILFVFVGMFILVSCKKEFIKTIAISENDSIEADSKGDDPSEVSFSEDESPGDAISGDEVPDNSFAGDIIPQDRITYLDGYRISNIADAGDYLWLSTIKEVYRLEKQTGTVVHFGFDNIEMPADYSISTIKCDENGLPWIGSRYTGTLKMTEEGKWVILPPVSTDEFERGTSHILFAYKCVVWISTINILAKYQGDMMETFTTNGSITSIQRDNEGNIWIGTADFFRGRFDGLVKFDGENWTVYDSSPIGSIPLIFGSIVIDKNGILWMGGYGGIDFPYSYLVEFDGTNWHAYRPINCTGTFIIYQIAIDKAGNKWLATNRGLITFDGSSFNRCDDLNSRLKSTIVFAVEIDNDGKKWVGTENGLAVFD